MPSTIFNKSGPPDGGYGWVITFAAFMVGVVLDGVCFSFGIYFNEFAHYFVDNSKASIAWVGSTLNGMYMISGPFVNALCNKYGCKRVTMLGAFVTLVAYVAAFFSPNLIFLTATFGILGGIGFGLMYLPVLVMVGFYFSKRRAFATGIAVCGSGIGGFVFPPLISFLMDQYAWRGTCLITAGLALHCMIFGALLRPLSSHQMSTIHDELCDPDPCTAKDTNSSTNIIKAKDLITTDVTNFYSLNELHLSSQKKHHCAGIRESPLKIAMSCHTLITHDFSVKDISRPMFHKDAYLFGSRRNLPASSNAKLTMKEKEEYIQSVLSSASQCSIRKKSFVERATKYFDFYLLLSPSFMTYCGGCVLCMLGFFIPFTFLPKLTESMGFSKSQQAISISCIGITNVIGRVLVGWISDQSWADCILINNVALILGGVVTALMPFYTNYATLLLSGVLFGLAIASFVSLRSIIIVELHGVDRLSSAFGLVTLSQGLSSFVGTPLAGALWDMTNDYVCTFAMAGGALALSGLICLPLRRISNWEKNRIFLQKTTVINGTTPANLLGSK